MAPLVYLDTHVVAWLYARLTAYLSETAKELIGSSELYISPIVQLELQYLYETGRTSEDGETVVSDLRQRIGLQRCEKPFTQVIAAAVNQDWTRDPFDRIIVAQAAITLSRLITRDETIREHYPHAVWERAS